MSNLVRNATEATRCPLTGLPGEVLRSREPDELAASYETYLGAPLPEPIIRKYFTATIHEYYNEESGLRWYEPALLGDGEYYATLAEIYPGYYYPNSWDKLTALDMIAARGQPRVVEAGCGDGWFLAELRKRGVEGIGVEINESAMAQARSQGLKVFLPGAIPDEEAHADILCLLQTIEHVADPVALLRTYIDRFHPRTILMSAPCFETILGHTKDPLSWPPHHATAWSRQAFVQLAARIGYELNEARYGPLDYWEMESRLRSEGSRKLWRLPYIPKGRLGRYLFKFCQVLKQPWALRNHSILVTLEGVQG